MSHPLAVAFVFGTTAITIGLTVLAFAAYRRTSNRALLFLMGAFLTLTTKGLLTGWALATDAIGHESLEMIGAGMDMLAVALLIAPFLRR